MKKVFEVFALRLIVLFSVLVIAVPVECSIEHNVKSRHKRYVAFPEGSSFSVSLCNTMGQIGNPNVDLMSYALNWGVAYDLPNETWSVQYANGFKNSIIPDKKPIIQRRVRRGLYEEFEIILDSMGYNGKDCIMRALCESSKFLSSRVGTMEEELLKTLFSMPIAKVLSREHRDIVRYDHAYRNARNADSCSASYPRCGFSLVALAFGKHSKTHNTFM